MVFGMTHGSLINFRGGNPFITLSAEVDRVERAADGVVSVCCGDASYAFGTPGLVFTSQPEYDEDPDVERFDMVTEILAAAGRAEIPVVDV